MNSATLRSGTAVAVVVGLVASGGLAQPIVTNVTGLDPATRAGNQAEVAYNVSVLSTERVETIAYNDDTGEAPDFVVHNATTRTVFPGASLLGWSFRARTPSNPNPPWAHAKLRPPPGVSVIWGDPAIASHPDLPQVVLITNLMMPQSKFPSGSLTGGVGGDCSPIGGACVARSLDGGKSFAIAGCFGDTAPTGLSCPTPLEVTNGHFYDGGAIAVARVGDTFNGFAGYVDVTLGQEAIWRMDDVTATTPSPFVHDTGRVGSLGDMGELGGIDTHLRLRTNGADLWKMSRDGTDLKVNIHARNGAFKVVADNARSSFTVGFGNDANGLPLGVRVGPQFAFDIGTNEAGEDEMRFIYIAQENGLFFAQAGFCSMDLAVCRRPAEWRFPAAGSPIEFHPTIKFGEVDSSTGRGVWKVTVMGKPSATTAAVFAADLVRPDLVPGTPTVVAGAGLVNTAVTPPQTPCPDLRLSGSGATLVSNGYWGDYDDMGFDPIAQSFTRPFTDSSFGCVSRLPFNSSEVHVSAVEIPLVTHLSLTGTIDITDHENIGSNETEHVVIDEECTVDPANPVDDHFDIAPCAGGEVTVVLRVTCTLQANSQVLVDVHSELREGGSCGRDIELEDSESQSKLVAIEQPQPPFAIDLTHDCFNCGDHAEIRLNVQNEGPR